SWFCRLPCVYSGIVAPISHSSSPSNRAYASSRLTWPARSDLTSVPCSPSPASKLSRISNLKRAFRFSPISVSLAAAFGGGFGLSPCFDIGQLGYGNAPDRASAGGGERPTSRLHRRIRSLPSPS